MNPIVRSASLTAAALLLLSGCLDRSPFEPVPFQLSDLLQAAVSEPTVSTTSSVSGEKGAVAWIAFAPGELGDASSAQVRNASTGATAGGEHPIVNGGLDPLPIEADVGDTLQVRLTYASGLFSYLSSVVPASHRPRVIRTRPTKGRTDVAVNASIVVVFSEPIDTTTVDAGTVRLTVAGEPVPGTFSFEPSPTLSVEFVPERRLLPGASYVVTIGDVRDLTGDPLEAPTHVDFFTVELLPPESLRALAFVRGPHIYAANADGTDEVRLTTAGNNADPAWSPEGSRLAFVSDRSGTRELYVMGAEEMVRRTYATSPNAGTYGPAWSPDGKRIAVQTRLEGGWTIASLSATEDGEPPVPLTEDPGQNQQPAWSPDGDRIAFVSDRDAYDFVYDLWIMEANGADERPLTRGFDVWPDFTWYLHPTWSPDGTSFAFVRAYVVLPQGLASYLRFMISVMAADGSGTVDLAWAGDITWMEVPDPGSIAWSPDGRTIAFTFVDCHYRGPCSGQRSVRYVTADGGEEGTLVPDGHSPSWRR